MNTFRIHFLLLLFLSFAICEILWDQTDGTTNAAWTSNFWHYNTEIQPPLTNATVAFADDFVVPIGNTWDISTVFILGTLYLPLNVMDTWRITFYSSRPNRLTPVQDEPYEVLFQFYGLGDFGFQSANSFTFVPPLRFTSGRYWLSVILVTRSTDTQNGVWAANLRDASINGEKGHPACMNDDKWLFNYPGQNYVTNWVSIVDYNRFPVSYFGGYSGLRFSIEGSRVGLTSGSVTSESLTTRSVTTSLVTTSIITTGRVGAQVITTSNFDNNQSDNNDNRTSSDSTTLIIVGISLGLLVILIVVGIAIIVVIVRKQRQPKKTVSSQNLVTSEVPMTEYRSLPEIENSSSNLNRNSIPETKSSANLLFSFEIDVKELRLETLIGRGSNGEVWKGIWRGAEVAVKKLRASLSERALSDLQREAETMSKLRPHVNVVQFLGIVTHPEVFLVTAFMEGGSLFSLLRSPEPLDGQIIKTIVTGIAAGMLHLHSEGIIHRDLAARNVLMGRTKNVKITDFGLSRAVSDEGGDRTGSDTGPVKWMSPESLLLRVYNIKTDIWSFGVVLVEIMTRNEPYPGIKALDVAMAVVKENSSLQLTAPPNSPKIIREFIFACLQRAPEKRPDFKNINSYIEESPLKDWFVS